MQDLENLVAFGYKISKRDIFEFSSWIDFDDPLKLMEYIIQNQYIFRLNWKDDIVKDKRFLVAWKAIFCNSSLSVKYSKDEWAQMLHKGNLRKINYSVIDQDEYNKMYSLIGLCIEHQSNLELIKMLVKKYDFTCTDHFIEKYAHSSNETQNKSTIIKYLESKLEKDVGKNSDNDDPIPDPDALSKDYQNLPVI